MTEKNKTKNKEVDDKEHKILLLGAIYNSSHYFLKLMQNENNRITIIDRKDPNLIYSFNDCKQYEGSERVSMLQMGEDDFLPFFIRDKDDLNTFDVIINNLNIHDASFAELNPKTTFKTNVNFTSDLMETLRRIDYTGRLIHCSTDKIYGILPKEALPITEEQLPNPVGVRAKTRYQQEVEVRSSAKTYGIRHIILRIGTTYGEFTPPEKAMNAWSRAMLLKEPLIIYGKENEQKESPYRGSRDWVDIDDVANLIAKIVQHDSKNIDNEIYNVGGCYPRERSMQNIAEAIKKSLKPLNPNPKMQYMGWRFETEEKGLKLWMNCEKAQKKLSYDPSEYNMWNITKKVGRWIAYYELGWGNRQMAEFEKIRGDIDSWHSFERQAAAEEDVTVKDELHGNITHFTKQLS